MSEKQSSAGSWTPQHPRLIYFLNQANQAIRSRLEDALREIQMTAVQYTVLSVIEARDGVSSAGLARRFFVTPQTMNELIAGLERREFITRSENPTNRRILTMELTKTGHSILRQCNEIADRIERDVCGWMTPDQYEQLRTLSREMARELRPTES
jgi:DNA-binding MarR family transcriptional regulator